MELIRKYMNNGMYLQVAQIWEKWALVFENEKMIKETAISYSASAKAYEKIQNSHKAINYYKKGINLLTREKNLDKKYKDLIYRWYVNTAIIECYYAINLKEAKEFLKKSENYFIENKYKN